VSVKKLSAFADTLDTGGMGIGQYRAPASSASTCARCPDYRWIDSAPRINGFNKRRAAGS
jgi:hypothetical protein